MTEFDGNLIQLTERLRRHPEDVRQLSVLRLVLTMIDKWNAQEDPVESSDEVPATAWVVRRKIEMVLPSPVAMEPEPPADAQEGPSPDVRWLILAVTNLQGLGQRARRHHRRPSAAWPQPLRPIRGRSLASLPLAWPQLRIRRPAAPARVYREVDPLSARLTRWQEWLSAEGKVTFPSSELSRSEVVAMFIALMLLWSQDHVTVEQLAIFDPLEVRPNEHSPSLTK